MLNNKGQSLVLFIIVFPVVLFILVLIIDIGKVLVLRQELNNISEIVLDYGLDKISSDNIYIANSDTNDLVNELVEIVVLNKKNVDLIDVRIDNYKIYIDLEEKEEGIFSSVVDISVFNVKSSYVGYIENDKKRIERVRGD